MSRSKVRALLGAPWFLACLRGIFFADVAELAYALALGASGEILGGSNPFIRTTFIKSKCNFEDSIKNFAGVIQR